MPVMADDAAPLEGVVGHWRDDAGHPVSDASFSGKPLVLTLTYTGCKTRCPLTLSRLEKLASVLERRDSPAQLVLVSLDPANDTPERLARFRADHHLGARWHLISGGLPETQALAKRLGVSVARDVEHLEHSVKTFLIDAQGKQKGSRDGWDFDEGEVAAAL